MNPAQEYPHQMDPIPPNIQSLINQGLALELNFTRPECGVQEDMWAALAAKFLLHTGPKEAPDHCHWIGIRKIKKAKA